MNLKITDHPIELLVLVIACLISAILLWMWAKYMDSKAIDKD
jgi:hypothetical protein